jgi:two-component sensor histidine kinase
MNKVLFLLLFFNYSFAQFDLPYSHGNNLINANKLEEAINYYNSKIKETNTDEQNIAVYMGLAEAHKLKLDYNSANDFYIKAFESIKRLNNVQLKLFYHVKMVEFYRKRTLFKQAVEQQKIADEIVKNHTIASKYLSKYYNRKAALFAEYYKLQDSTLYYSKKSLKLALQNKDNDDVFYSTLEISGVLEQKKQYEEAIIYLEDLIIFSEKNNLIQQRVDAYTNYTRVLVKSNNLKKALEQTIIALEFAKENKILFSEILFLDNLSLIYQKTNKPQKAYDYLKMRLELTDIYYQKEHNKFLFDLEAKYNLSQKEKQIKISNLEIENQKETLASNKTKLYGILGLLLLVILIAVIITYFLRKAKTTNKSLQFLANQNELLLGETNHRINNNLQLITILISEQLKKVSSAESKEIKKIIKKISSISALHRHLYQSNDKSKVNSTKYFRDIKDNFFDLFQENNINASVTIQSMELPSDIAMYLGLLVTELFINTIKHAFEEKDFKEIHLDIRRISNVIYFEYSDNGNSIAANFEKPKLIDKLCQQLKIQYTIKTENGFRFSFEKEIDFN